MPESTSPSPQPRRQRTRLLKRIALGAAGLALIAALVVAALPKPVPVEVGQVVRSELLITVDEDGQTRVKDRYIVSAPLNGRLERIQLRPGDVVEQGQVIARIAPLESELLDRRARETAEARVAAAAAAVRQAAAQVERGRAALEFARRTVERNRELFAQGTLSQQGLDQAELELRSRQAELTSLEFAAKIANYELKVAQATLGRHSRPPAEQGEQVEVTSPVTGKVLRVMHESEGAVQAGAPIIEVGDPRALEIVADVLTRDAVEIDKGAEVVIDRWGGEPLHGQVRLVEPSAFTKISALGVEEQRVNVIIDLLDPFEDWSALGDGYRVETRIAVWHQTDVLTAPASALFRQGEGWAVFTVEKGEAALRRVVIGRQNAARAQVLEGLEAFEIVVLHPSDRVEHGVPLELP